MEYVVTAKEMKQADNNMIEKIGIPSMVLMERAACMVLEEIHLYQAKQKEKRKSAFILAGCGNNGADGLAIARLLADEEYKVEVLICGKKEKASAEWKQQFSILKNYPVKEVSKPTSMEYNILVDALFGVGLSREVEGEYKEQIQQFNNLLGYKIAVDIPSGIHSDNGAIMGCAVKADATVTFAFGKRGLFFYPGAEYAGKVSVKDIGIGKRSFFGTQPEMFRYTESAEKLLPVRQAWGNKGTFGKVLLAAGNNRMAGAAVLAAKGAGRIGAGMVKVITPECNREILLSNMPEALFGTLIEWRKEIEKGLFWADVIAVGPGIGKEEYGKQILQQAVECSSLPLVIDADALNLIAEDTKLKQDLAMQSEKGRTLILTPHLGEMARLTGKTIAQIQQNPIETAKELAKQLHCIVVSKDACTIICQEKGEVCINTIGNSGMATAGSGDVLTGIIAGLLAQKISGFEAAAKGVYFHALAGDAAAKKIGEHALLAGEIAEAVQFGKAE